jgi:hypothetical protein
MGGSQLSAVVASRFRRWRRSGGSYATTAGLVFSR